MIVELIETEELEKFDKGMVENLTLGFSKFDPFSKNPHPFSDHCLCRKCKWHPTTRSKRILESEFVEITGPPKPTQNTTRNPRPQPTLKRVSSDESILDGASETEQKKRKTFEENSPGTGVNISIPVDTADTGMDVICQDTINLRLYRRNSRPLDSNSTDDDSSSESGERLRQSPRGSGRKIRNGLNRLRSKPSPIRRRVTKVSPGGPNPENEPLLVEIPHPVLQRDNEEIKVDEEIIILPDNSTIPI